MKYKINLEFDTLAELSEFIKSIEPPAEGAPGIVYDISTIRNRAASHYKRWTKFEEDYLVNNFYRFKLKEIGKSLGRSESSVNMEVVKLKRLGRIKVGKKPGRHGKITVIKDTQMIGPRLSCWCRDCAKYFACGAHTGPHMEAFCTDCQLQMADPQYK